MLRGNLAIWNPNYVKKLQLKQIFCCETRVRGKLVASPSPNYRQYTCIRLQVFVLLQA